MMKSGNEWLAFVFGWVMACILISTGGVARGEDAPIGGLFCDTVAQVKMFANATLKDRKHVNVAIDEINAEHGDVACALVHRPMMFFGDEVEDVETIYYRNSVVTIKKVLVKGSATVFGSLRAISLFDEEKVQYVLSMRAFKSEGI